MTRNEYKTKREELINKAQEALDNNMLDSFDTLYKQIENLDEQHKDLINKEQGNYQNEIFNYLTANYQAMNKDNSISSIFLQTGESIKMNGGNNLMQQEPIKNIFLNKGDKLESQIKLNGDESNILNKQGALADVVRGMVTGKWSSQELKNVVGTTATGTLIPSILSSRIIDKAREISIFTVAGVPIVPMDSNNMTISRVVTDPVLKFKKEGAEATESEFELDSVKLESKTCYGYAYVSLEAIHSSVNLESILYDVFSKAMANAIDKGFLYGQNDEMESPAEYAPAGILRDININTITATESSGYDDFIKAIGKVRQANGAPTTYAINADTEELLSLLKTSNGEYINEPKAMTELQRIVSNQLNHDISLGDDALVFDKNALLIGVQNNIQIKIIQDAECLKKGLVGFQIFSMLDCKTVMPKHVCLIKGIK